MSHEVIKYRLTPKGEVPDFLCLHPDGVGGMYAVASPGTTQHDDTVFVGLANPGATGNFEVVATQADLETYLAQVGADWVEPVDPTNPSAGTKPFDPAAAAQWVWERKTALDLTE